MVCSCSVHVLDVAALIHIVRSDRAATCNDTNEKLIIFHDQIKVEMFFSAIMCLVTGQQFRYSHNLPHTCIILELHRKPDLLASAIVPS